MSRKSEGKRGRRMEFSRVILRKDGKRVRCSRSFVTRSLYLVARDVSKLDARGSSFYLVSHGFPPEFRGDTRVQYDPPLWNFNCRACKRLVSFSPCITRFRRDTSIHRGLPQLLPIRFRIFFYFTALSPPPSSHGFQRKRSLFPWQIYSLSSNRYMRHFQYLLLSLEGYRSNLCMRRTSCLEWWIWMIENDLFLTILLRSNEYVDESWMKTFDVIDVIINEFSIKRNSGRSGVVNAKSCL